LHASLSYDALQVGAGRKRAKRLTKSALGHFAKYLGPEAAVGANPKRVVHEFRVTPDALLPSGTELDVRHFKAGQFLDVIGTSTGKGYAGVMKRHNFSGARHGDRALL
jgi:large subunit ribosomal protein L3